MWRKKTRRSTHGTPRRPASPDESAAVPRRQPQVLPADGDEPRPVDGSPPPGAGAGPGGVAGPGTGTDLDEAPDLDKASDGAPDEEEFPDTRNFLVRGASAAGLRTGRVVHGTGRMDPQGHLGRGRRRVRARQTDRAARAELLR